MDLGTSPNLEVSLDPTQQQLEIDESIANRSRNIFILANQKTSIVMVLFVVAALFFVLKSSVDPIALYSWTAVCVLTYMLRYALCVSFNNSSDDDKAEVKWERWFTAIVGATGCVWGASAFLIFPEGAMNHQLFLVLVIVILSAGAIVTHSVYKAASVAFAVASVSPIILKFLLFSEDGLSEIGVILTLFLILMVYYSAQLRKIGNKLFFLSYENNKLILDLKSSNAELVEKNELLSHTQQALREVNDELQKLATTDALTGLTNRRRFEALTKVKWARCAESKSPLSLMIINIDRFKQYNDFYGQRKGDSCLISIGELLRNTPEINRPGDSLARYSGGELAVLLVDANESYAQAAAEEIRRGVEKLRLSRAELPNEISPWLSVSIGISTECEFRDRSCEDMFSLADDALHRAKKAGRNQVNHSGGSAIANHSR